MQIANLPKRFPEVGRIRLGDKVETKKMKDGREITVTNPRKLTRFRFTSSHADLLTRVAEVYGGTVRAWDDAPTGKNTQHELYVEAETIDVMIPDGQILTQSYELWDKGGCKRRCNGIARDTGEPCDCPIVLEERIAAAAAGKACKLTTRVSMWLPRVPGMGVWRLESHGYYAAVELPGAADVLSAATAMGKPLLATLRIVSRRVVRDGKTNQFTVPQLDLATSVTEMFALASGHQEPSYQIAAQRAQAIEAPATAALPAASAQNDAQPGSQPSARQGSQRRRAEPAGPVEVVEPPSAGAALIGRVKTSGQWHAEQLKQLRDAHGKPISAKAFDEDPQWAALVAEVLDRPEPPAETAADSAPVAEAAPPDQQPEAYPPGEEPF